MSLQISSAVGRWEKGAPNLMPDVFTVQDLLTTASRRVRVRELDPKGVDGGIARPPAKSSTVAAIEAFQRRFTSVVDGVIEPGSQSWAALLLAAGEATPAPEPAAPADTISPQSFVFPFSVVPGASWLERPRCFAAPRANGRRLHAGCDLYFPKGTPIQAVADGVVTRGPYAFYAETFALEIDHGSLLARYGEIQRTTDVREGDRVQAGQVIARVGHLVGIEVPSDMLHLELYDKSQSGPLTVAAGAASAKRDGVAFMRRKDLLDPTPFLNEWRENLPPPPSGGS